MSDGQEQHWYAVKDPGEHQKARREVANTLRALVDECLMSAVSIEELASAGDFLESALGVLRERRGASFVEAVENGEFRANPITYADRNPVIGKANPIAPPMLLESDGEWVVGKVNLGSVYEGPPGFVHGGVISGLLDQLFGSLMVREGTACLTGRLTVRYRRPTPIGEDLVLKARIARTAGRRYMCDGLLSIGDQKMVDADAMMVAVNNEHLVSLFGQSGMTSPGGGS